MAGNKILYKVTGRYMSGREVVGYHMISDNGKQGMYSRDTVAYLVGKGQVVNCSGQVSNGKFSLKGVGISIDALPVKQIESGNNISRHRGSKSTGSGGARYTIVAKLLRGNELAGYMVRSSLGETRKVPLNKVLDAASKGGISNATIQNMRGTAVIVGVGCDLNNLPSIQI